MFATSEMEKILANCLEADVIPAPEFKPEAYQLQILMDQVLQSRMQEQLVLQENEKQVKECNDGPGCLPSPSFALPLDSDNGPRLEYLPSTSCAALIGSNSQMWGAPLDKNSGIIISLASPPPSPSTSPPPAESPSPTHPSPSENPTFRNGNHWSTLHPSPSPSPTHPSPSEYPTFQNGYHWPTPSPSQTPSEYPSFSNAFPPNPPGSESPWPPWPPTPEHPGSSNTPALPPGSPPPPALPPGSPHPYAPNSPPPPALPPGSPYPHAPHYPPSPPPPPWM